MRKRTWGVWLSWLAAGWLLAIFIASILDYSRGIDVVVLLIGLIAELVIAVAWTLWRPLPLWIVAGWGLIALSSCVGLLITVPGDLFLSWMLVGLVPVGVAMLLASIVSMERSTSLTH